MMPFAHDLAEYAEAAELHQVAGLALGEVNHFLLWVVYALLRVVVAHWDSPT